MALTAGSNHLHTWSALGTLLIALSFIRSHLNTLQKTINLFKNKRFSASFSLFSSFLYN